MLFRILRSFRILLIGAIAIVGLMMAMPGALAFLHAVTIEAPTASQLAQGQPLEYQPSTREGEEGQERFRADGECSVPVTVPFGLRAACQVHDLAYDELRVARESGQYHAATTAWARWMADVEFTLRGHRQCDAAPLLGRPLCHGVVAVMGTAVTLNSLRQGYGATPQESPVVLMAWGFGAAALLGAPRRSRGAGRHEREFHSAVRSPDVVGMYVGVRHASTLSARLRLLREALQQGMTGSGGVVVLVVTTGSGWVNPHVVEGLQRATSGPVTIIALQYSRLPSWAVALFRPWLPARTARAAIAAASDAAAVVRRHGGRVRLLVHGESLGAAAIRTAFAQRPQLAAAVDGGLLVSPPGSVEWDGPAHIDVVRHRDDAVVWFTLRLLVRPLRWRPAACDGYAAAPPYRGPWRPLLSYLQVFAALPRAGDLPFGRGHRYGPELTRAWARVLARSGRSAQGARTAG
ncbi:alpha/beta-hydrolase family protein [Ruania halotolerans]|uniref:alpha/beta-hydrolase family protein n=1 Tax=Ruania halotolerans TaxID=2897773 RepID=UPI001E4BA01A|nr:alpha/beta-hydrolase family protein [Ruania halotolerans]UFU06385.1 alpha/beta-hydrolase family protein [Ruania halotolerans]